MSSSFGIEAFMLPTNLPEGAVVYVTHPLGHSYTYTRDDGHKVSCYGKISDTPQLCIHLGEYCGCGDEQTITIQYRRTFDSGNILSTWRAWTNYLNKHSQFAGRIVRIESTNRRVFPTHSEK